MGHVQELVDEIARLLDASVTLEDRSFQLIAYGAQSGHIDAVREEVILRRRATPATRAHFEAYGIATAEGPVRIPPLGDLLGRVCVPLRHGGVTYGYLWLLDSGDLTDDRLAAVAPLVARAAAELARQTRTRQTPLGDLFSANPETRAAADVSALAGPLVALAVKAAPGQVAALWTLPHEVRTDLSLAHPAFLAPAALTRDLATRLHGLYGTAIGVGAPRQDAEDAWESWREALGALRVAEARRLPVAYWTELGVYRYLVRLPHSELAELAAESAPLGELAATVECYLDHGGHVQEAAAELGVHRQTLYYRLGRAAELTGLDLGKGESRLLLHLSLKAAHL
ncbi:PucR family transcriptional regulator [Acrocarpospora catenulata]|uniref:PucR family transcriptional regulator n=1 Tax=Acrocarpospora catenulata TaxID=2836182 RepID=UPI001BD92A20|nr:helix-turn-helix domain-containing protein [Acrocarpospora catenulata]